MVPPRSSLLFVSLCVISLGACANPINMKTGSKYYERGTEAERHGDFERARENYRRAAINAQLARGVGRDRQTYVAEAYSVYAWSRMSGYLGFHDEAERGFGDALDLIEKASPKADSLRLPLYSELGRMFHDLGQHEKAVPAFRLAFEELERRSIEVHKRDLEDLARMCDDYADSLRATGDDAFAQRLEARAAQIRLDHPERPAARMRRYTAPAR